MTKMQSGDVSSQLVGPGHGPGIKRRLTLGLVTGLLGWWLASTLLPCTLIRAHTGQAGLSSVLTLTSDRASPKHSSSHIQLVPGPNIPI